MNIKKVSEITKLSIHTLRYYEKIGLIMNIERDSKGHRSYNEMDILFIDLIKRLKDTKMPLNEIRNFASLRSKGDSTIDKRVRILEKHYKKVEEEIENLKVHRKKIKEKIKICRLGGPLKNP